VLTARIAQLIHEHGARPWQVLAITFTNKVRRVGRLRAAASVQGPLAGAAGVVARCPLPLVSPQLLPTGPLKCPLLRMLFLLLALPCLISYPQAAFEMRERLAAMLEEEAAKELFAGTFHR
jgi:superfamily I DNA/RNA helicase